MHHGNKGPSGDFFGTWGQAGLGVQRVMGKWQREAALQTLKVIGDRMTPAVSSLTMNLRRQRC